MARTSVVIVILVAISAIIFYFSKVSADDPSWRGSSTPPPPFTVSVVPFIYPYFGSIKVVATEEFDLKKITLNRGNCPGYNEFEDQKLPKHLKFGDTFSYTYKCETVLEGMIQADRGEWTYSFK